MSGMPTFPSSSVVYHRWINPEHNIYSGSLSQHKHIQTRQLCGRLHFRVTLNRFIYFYSKQNKKFAFASEGLYTHGMSTGYTRRWSTYTSPTLKELFTSLLSGIGEVLDNLSQPFEVYEPSVKSTAQHKSTTGFTNKVIKNLDRLYERQQKQSWNRARSNQTEPKKEDAKTQFASKMVLPLEKFKVDPNEVLNKLNDFWRQRLGEENVSLGELQGKQYLLLTPKVRISAGGRDEKIVSVLIFDASTSEIRVAVADTQNANLNILAPEAILNTSLVGLAGSRAPVQIRVGHEKQNISNSVDSEVEVKVHVDSADERIHAILAATYDQTIRRYGTSEIPEIKKGKAQPLKPESTEEITITITMPEERQMIATL